MGRSRNYDKEFTQNDKLKKENAQLKRDIAKLRRQLERLNIDHDRYRTLKELDHKQRQADRKAEKAKKDRTCFECGKGKMKLFKIFRPDGEFYLRRCVHPGDTKGCGHQTRLKKFTENVEE